MFVQNLQDTSYSHINKIKNINLFCLLRTNHPQRKLAFAKWDEIMRRQRRS